MLGVGGWALRVGCCQQDMSLSVPGMSTAAAMTADQGCDPDPQRHLQLGQDLLPDLRRLSYLGRKKMSGQKEREAGSFMTPHTGVPLLA